MTLYSDYLRVSSGAAHVNIDTLLRIFGDDLHHGISDPDGRQTVRCSARDRSATAALVVKSRPLKLVRPGHVESILPSQIIETQTAVLKLEIIERVAP